MILVRIRRLSPPLEVEFTCPSGVNLLYGPHGAGKTGVLEAIAGLVKPDDGRILADDRILFDGGTGVNLPPVARPIGYIAQNSTLFPHMSVRENLLFAASCRRLARLERHRRAGELLERFQLTDVAGRPPSKISAAESQRAVVARALAGQPSLLLLDDPARGLDTPLRQELYGLVRRVSSEWGVSVLMATGELEDCYELGDLMQVLIAGKLAQTGLPREVIDQPANIDVARLLGSFNLLPAEITALDPGRKTSRLKLGETDLAGPYFPGRFRGDRVTLCVRPMELTASAASGRPGPNQVPARLIRVTELAQTVRLTFDGEIAVEMSRADYGQRKHHRDWFIEFPADRLRAL